MRTRLKRRTLVILLGAFGLAGIYLGVFAGNLEPPGSPAPTMKTLEEVEPRLPISSLPFTVSSSGSYYLTRNLIGSSGQDGITIDADDVTIDLNGFALIGVAGSLSGIRANGAVRYSIEVKNGTVSYWGASGIAMSVARNSVVRNIRAIQNLAGGLLLGPTTIVTQCLAQENGVTGSHSGIAFSDSTGSIVESCVVRANTGNGIGATSNAIIRNNFVYNNGWEGIAVGNVNLVVNNVSSGNTIGAGVRVTSGGNRIEGNQVGGNARGFHVDGTTNVIIRNTAKDNTIADYGIVAGNFVGTVVATEAAMNAATNDLINISF